VGFEVGDDERSLNSCYIAILSLYKVFQVKYELTCEEIKFQDHVLLIFCSSVHVLGGSSERRPSKPFWIL